MMSHKCTYLLHFIKIYNEADNEEDDSNTTSEVFVFLALPFETLKVQVHLRQIRSTI